MELILTSGTCGIEFNVDCFISLLQSYVSGDVDLKRQRRVIAKPGATPQVGGKEDSASAESAELSGFYLSH
jgi:hypothetical protein